MSTSPLHDRLIDNRTVPPVGTFAVDPSHSSLELVVRHLMIAKVRSRFTDWTAELVIAERPEDSVLNVDIELASFSSGDEQRDGHVRGADFLDVEQHPRATFHSTAVRPVGGSQWQVSGDLTLKGVTQPVTLEVVYGGMVTDPFGNTKALFSAEAEINREDFGVSFNAPLNTGGVLIGSAVRIEIELQAVPKA